MTQSGEVSCGHLYSNCPHRKNQNGGLMRLSSSSLNKLLFQTACGCALLLTTASFGAAQQQPGPQVDAPAPIAPRQIVSHSGGGQRLMVPSGTRLAVVLENGISTRSAKAGDSLYFHTAFPVTQNNQVVIPVGSYLRGSLLESRRPGRI